MSRIRPRTDDYSPSRLAIDGSVCDFQLDLAALSDAELGNFLTQSIDILDAATTPPQASTVDQSGGGIMSNKPSSPSLSSGSPAASGGGGGAAPYCALPASLQSRLAQSIVRCIKTMPWGRLYAVGTVPANLLVESRKPQPPQQSVPATSIALTSTGSPVSIFRISRWLSKTPLIPSIRNRCSSLTADPTATPLPPSSPASPRPRNRPGGVPDSA